MARYDCVFCGSQITYDKPEELKQFLGAHYPDQCSLIQNAGQQMKAVTPAPAAPAATQAPPGYEEKLPFEPEGDWEEQTPAFYTFEKAGDTVEGVLQGVDEIDLSGDKVKRARVETEDGPVSFLLGAQLVPLIATLQPGTMVRVRYEGTVQSRSKRPVKQFKVWTKKA